MKKLFVLASLVVIASSLTSCGRTVRLVGENNVTANAGNITETTSVNTTTAPVTTLPKRETAPPKVSIRTDMPEKYELKKSFVIDGFETVMQEPELPTGCEITSLTQTMNFYGFKTDKVEMCDVFLPVDIEGMYTMDEYYIGDPHSEHGFGCNSSVIVKTADDYFEYAGSDWYAVDLTGIDFKELLFQVEQGRPVITWSTIDQVESTDSIVPTLGNGDDFYFNYYQHCLTVYGYDFEKNTVHVADPLKGNVEYDMQRFERIFNNMKNQAVILVGNEESAGKIYTDKKEQENWLKINRPEPEETTGTTTTTTTTVKAD